MLSPRVTTRSEVEHGGGYYRSAWGFVRPLSDSGALVTCSPDPEPFVEHGPSEEVDPDGAARFRDRLLNVAMYKYQEPSWVERRVHVDSVDDPSTLLSAVDGLHGGATGGSGAGACGGGAIAQ